MRVRVDDDVRYDARFVETTEIVAQNNPYTADQVTLTETFVGETFQRKKVWQPLTIRTGALMGAVRLWCRTDATPGAYVTIQITRINDLEVHNGEQIYPWYAGVRSAAWVPESATLVAVDVAVGAWFEAGEYMLVISSMESFPGMPVDYENRGRNVYVGAGDTSYATYYSELVIFQFDPITGMDNWGIRKTIMASPYFDISFSDSGVTEDLGVVLAESNALQYSVTWQSPFASQLGQGQVKEQDLTAYKVITQNDWRGGRGQETVYQQPTNAYRDAVADTRFMNMAVLGPQTNRTQISAAANIPQSYTPSSTGNNPMLSNVSGSGTLQLAQKFTTGAAGYVLTTIRLLLQKYSFMGTYTLFASIYSDVGNKPGAAVSPSFAANTSDFDASQANPQYVRFTNACSLAANTSYWIVLWASVTTGGQLNLFWLSSTVPPYYAPIMSYMSGLGWGDISNYGLAFMLNNGAALPGDVLCNPVAFGSGWYAASGNALYRLNTSTALWEQQGAIFAATITALAVLGSTLYIAVGDSSDMQSTQSGSTFVPVTSRRYTYLYAYSGYLYACKSSGGAAALSYFNGTAWADLTLGTAATLPTALTGFSNEIIITTTAGMYSLSSNYVYQVLDFSSQQSAVNGKGAAVWPGSGLLYVPIRNSLIAYNGQTTTQAGLDLLEGLPAGEQGRISAMAGTANWLFAGVDAGTTGRSGVYVYNGGWHCLLKAASTGARIQAMGIEAVTDAGGVPRLWWAEGMDMYYIALPQTTDNPYLYSGSTYQSTGYINGSRWLGELAGIDKDLQSVVIRSENCSAGQTIQVQIELDRSGQWWTVGTVTKSPLQELELLAASMVTKTIVAGSTDTIILVTGGSTLADMAAGSFVRIGAEVRQVISVDSATRFTLNRPLDAGAPAGGTLVVSSRPAGREVNYRVVLATTDNTRSPKLLSVSIRYMEQLIDKARITLSIPVGDCSVYRNGAKSSLTGAQLYDALVVWGKRLTPFFLVGPDGISWRVKCAGSMSWNGITRTTDMKQTRKVKGTLTMQLMEV